MNSTAPRKPLFITLEGLDGCGKSSQIDTVVAFCESANPLGVIVTREPGGTEIGERIRHILLDHALIEARSELLLVFAARVQHLKTVIEPALSLGKTVVCDRYADATYAYQGYGRGLPLALIDSFMQALEVRAPDLTLLFDVPIEVALARRSGRPADRIESESREFFARVHAGYLARAQAQPGRIAVVAADRSLTEVSRAVEAVLQSAHA